MRRIIDEAIEKVRHIVETRRPALEALTQRLIEVESVNADELQRIIEENSPGPLVVPGTTELASCRQQCRVVEQIRRRVKRTPRLTLPLMRNAARHRTGQTSFVLGILGQRLPRVGSLRGHSGHWNSTALAVTNENAHYSVVEWNDPRMTNHALDNGRGEIGPAGAVVKNHAVGRNDHIRGAPQHSVGVRDEISLPRPVALGGQVRR